MKKYLYSTVLLLCIAGLTPGAAVAGKKTPRKEIALQLYSLRGQIGSYGSADGRFLDAYREVLGRIAEMGYTGVEAAGYNDGKFYGRTPEEFKADVEGVGMEVLSSHTSRGLSAEELASGDFTESMKWWDRCIAAHKAAGMKYIVTPSMITPKTLKDLKTYCDYYNEIGKRCKEAGISYGYHNHAYEFQKIEGTTMYDFMLEHTDPAYVFFQMDVYWVVRGQNSPVDYFNKYKGRFKLLHIKDEREIGQSGMVGFDAIFRNADAAGVENIIVEVERYSFEPEVSVKQSIDYLLKNDFVRESYRR